MTYEAPESARRAAEAVVMWYPSLPRGMSRERIEAKFARAIAGAQADALEQGGKAIRRECSACDNGVAGYETHTEPRHDPNNPDGEPIPVQVQGDAVECEYCGRPMHVLDAIAARYRPPTPDAEEES